ncbi:MAG: hypothetical protein HC837_14600 [Chloroflexaceae bacterium]|nr:hypothetical protein [Chloroflexaceae bacterium]
MADHYTSLRNNHKRRQRIGLRPSLEPYYTITEQTDQRLVLSSRPRANARDGQTFMGCGALLLLVTLMIFCSSYVTGTEDVFAALAGMVVALLCGIPASLGLFGGYAIATTRNTITVDAQERVIIYAQRNRVARERTQTVPWERVRRFRFRPGRFAPPGLIQRKRWIAVLEMVLVDDDAWLIDTAMDLNALLPTAEAFVNLLQLELDDEMSLDEDTSNDTHTTNSGA